MFHSQFELDKFPWIWLWVALVLALVVAVVCLCLLEHELPVSQELKPQTFHSADDTAPCTYPATTVAKLASGSWIRPRAKVSGIVTFIHRERDGDLHVRLEDGGKFIICEQIPELQHGPTVSSITSKPAVGNKIEIWGIVRYDGEHKWWELHPYVGWRRLP